MTIHKGSLATALAIIIAIIAIGAIAYTIGVQQSNDDVEKENTDTINVVNTTPNDGHPTTNPPTSNGTVDNNPPVQAGQTASQCGLEITTPTMGATISSPVVINGTLDVSGSGCNWVAFEGEAGLVQLVDQSGNSYGQGLLTVVESDWMERLNAGQSITVSAEITATSPLPSGQVMGIAIVENDPSGIGTPETIAIPVIAQ